MKMNLFRFSIFITVFSLSLFSVVSAQGDNGALVATVNITNAKITSQDGNIFNISFDLNNREGLQGGVKYGVEVFSGTLSSQNMVDEKIYDETLSLAEHSNTHREIVYSAPSSLNGTYTIVLVSRNESNFPFGVVSLGEVKLSGIQKSIQILTNSCYLTIEGEKNSPRHSLAQEISISSEEKLKLTCNAVNYGEKTTANSHFETRSISSFGAIVPVTQSDSTHVTLSKSEQKTFSLTVPKVGKPGAYYGEVTLVGDGISSNAVHFNYAIKGPSATIYKLTLDKDYYKTGETSMVSLIWSGYAGKLNINVTSDDNNCGDTISKDLEIDPGNTETKVFIPINRNCVDPEVEATITDESGNVLDHKEFAFESTGSQTKSSGKSNLNFIFVIALILIVIFIVIKLMKRKEVMP